CVGVQNQVCCVACGPVASPAAHLEPANLTPITCLQNPINPNNWLTETHKRFFCFSSPTHRHYKSQFNFPKLLQRNTRCKIFSTTSCTVRTFSMEKSNRRVISSTKPR